MKDDALQQARPTQATAKSLTLSEADGSGGGRPVLPMLAPGEQGREGVERALQGHAHAVAGEGWGHGGEVTEAEFLRVGGGLPAEEELIDAFEGVGIEAGVPEAIGEL